MTDQTKGDLLFAIRHSIELYFSIIAAQESIAIDSFTHDKLVEVSTTSTKSAIGGYRTYYQFREIIHQKNWV
ncbi:MAG: hypothetical protein ACM65M_17970 [Microcoleus sp.]